MGGQALATPADAAAQSARELMSKGRAARARDDLQEALASFSAADAIMHVPTTALEVARTQAALGLLLEAMATLEQMLARPAEPDEPAVFKNARNAAGQLKGDLSQLIPKLRFKLNPGQAKPSLSLDGEPQPADVWDQGLLVNPGQHRLTAELDGAQQERALEIAAHTSPEVAFEFDPPANPKPVSERSALPPPETQGTLGMAFVYGLSGLALASAGVGVAFGAEGKSRKHELESSCAPNCASTDIERARTMYRYANISFGCSAAAAVSAVVLYLVRPSAPAPTAAQNAPAFPNIGWQVGPYGTGLAVDGKF
jgi:hypothetical protein